MGRGNNHSWSCTCGWCTSTWGGGGGGRNQAYYAERLKDWLKIGPREYHWKYRTEDYCRPTNCPICGAPVFFVRHNGGSVWFDALGKPWPKHACFDNDTRRSIYLNGYYYETANTTSSSHQKITRLVEHLTEPLIGVVVEVHLSVGNSGHRIVIRCANSQLLVAYVGARVKALLLVGELVIVSKIDNKLVIVDYNIILPIRAKPVPPPMHFVVGQKYEHPVYGVGILTWLEKVEGHFFLTIEFEDGSKKRFDNRYAKLKYVSA